MSSNALRLLNQFAARRMDESERAGDFLQYARFLISRGDDLFAALVLAERTAKGSRPAECLKAAVSAGTTTAADWLGVSPYSTMASGFMESLVHSSIFQRMRSDGMKRVPLEQRLVVVTTGLTGTTVPEGQAKPLGSLGLDSPSVAIRKSSAIIVINSEVAKFATNAAISLFSTELRSAVSRCVDQTFLSEIAASAAQVASTGTTAAAAAADIKALLSNISLSSSSRLFLILGPAAARALSMFGRDSSAPCYPGVNVTGEGELAGVTTLVSDMLPNDTNSPTAPTALLIDASQIIGDNADPAIVLDSSRYATLQMAAGTAPDSPEGPSTVATSLYQTDRVALKSEAFYGFSLARSSGVAASLTGIQW